MSMDNDYDENNHQNRTTLSLYYGMRVLMSVAAGLFLFWGEWESGISTILILLLMLVPSLLRDRYRLYLPFALDLGIVSLIFITLFLGHMGRFYDNVPLWDKFAHFQSGLLLGVIGFVIVYVLNENRNIKLGLSPAFLAVFSVAFSLAMGVIWEIVEFIGDSFFGSLWQANNTDTMWDLIATGVGAIIVSTVGFFWMCRHERLPFTPWLMKIFRKKI